MPRRSDDSVRVGLYSIVRASRSSKLSKLSGPLMNSAMVDDFLLVHPGVTSTSTTLRTSSGAWSASAIVVMPPSDMPMTACASGASARIATATSSALACDVDDALAATVGVAVAGEVEGHECERGLTAEPRRRRDVGDRRADTGHDRQPSRER